ncbi:hypothetical protein CEV33_2242 [Brucella grignonensis]|uniref:Uncharacterized protein n=1 Tax=Brucella grignonensis TaxID=94627 RepID=A0A256F7U6_9HYPH|nr:hypothetical protein CEV33_2242 [Brucella grignonensis]
MPKPSLSEHEPISCHFVAPKCAPQTEFSVIFEISDYSILTVYK